MELTLDRALSNQRIFPALNITQSGTRKEEKLMDEKTLAAARNIRRHLISMQPPQAMKALLEALQKHKTNQSLFDSMAR
jgi:transcription termination factor Rho